MPNLQPLYDIKERLEHAAIAGTNLLSEDFRLTRAAEALTPLAKASPVFAKIDAGVRALLAAPPEGRSTALLDTLSLVDAVAYTQGVTGCPGDLMPLPPGSGVMRPLSYGQLHPLLEALTGTGGGRASLVQSRWEADPEQFRDFRILPAVIAGLGDSYGGLADLNARILTAMGPAILPRLQEGFDPAGKKDMVRRVEVIAKAGGSSAEPWLRQILPLAKKDVREAAIDALRPYLSTQELLEMAVTEKGKCREAVLRGLAQQEGEAVKTFWREEAQRRTGTHEFLRDASSSIASDLVAEQLRRLFETGFAEGWPGPTGFLQSVADWLHAAEGKTSPAMIDFWRWIDSRYDDVPSTLNKTGRFTDLKTAVPTTLLDSLLRAGPGPVAEVCWELYQKRPDEPRYLPFGFLAALLQKPAAEVYTLFAPYLLLEDSTPLHRRQSDALLGVISHVRWSKEKGRQCVSASFPVAEPMDPRWFDRLAQVLLHGPVSRESQYTALVAGEVVEVHDSAVLCMADPTDPAVRISMTSLIHSRMTQLPLGHYSPPWMTYSSYLLQFGGSLRGVLAESMTLCTKPIYVYYIWKFFDDYRDLLTPAETADVLEELGQGIQAKHILVDQDDIAEKAIPYTIAELRAGRAYPEWSVWWDMRP